MNTKRALRFFAALAVAILAAFGLAQPASAYPNWDPISWSSAACSTTQHNAFYNVDYQACTVYDGNYMQIVAVVVNNSGTGVYIQNANVYSTISGNAQVKNTCDGTTLGAGVRRGCYGATRFIPCGTEIEGSIEFFIGGNRYSAGAVPHSHC